MKLKGVVIEIDGKDHKLSIKEAKKLHDQLSELFAEPNYIGFPQIQRSPYDDRAQWPPVLKTWCDKTIGGDPYRITCGKIDSVDTGPAFN